MTPSPNLPEALERVEALANRHERWADDSAAAFPKAPKDGEVVARQNSSRQAASDLRALVAAVRGRPEITDDEAFNIWREEHRVKMIDAGFGKTPVAALRIAFKAGRNSFPSPPDPQP